jgi:hypothetical protein
MEEGTLAAEDEPIVRLWPVVGVDVWLVTGCLGATAAVAMAAEEAFREDIDVMRITPIGAFASCVRVCQEKVESGFSDQTNSHKGLECLSGSA